MKKLELDNTYLFNINEDLKIKGVIKTAKTGVRYINISHMKNETILIFESQRWLIDEVLERLNINEIQLQDGKTILDLLCYLVSEDTYKIFLEVYRDRENLKEDYLLAQAEFYAMLREENNLFSKYIWDCLNVDL